jgi:hypothetical protein
MLLIKLIAFFVSHGFCYSIGFGCSFICTGIGPFIDWSPFLFT